MGSWLQPLGWTAAFSDKGSQSWLCVRNIWEIFKRPTPRDGYPETLKPIHSAEPTNSNNSCSPFLSRGEKDIALQLRYFYFTFRMFNYFILFDLPSTEAIALSCYWF